MRVIGVDVSHWEGVINWQLAAPTIGFAYYKCTDGIFYSDSQFENNRIGCRENNIPNAPYHYWQPMLDSNSQAAHFIAKAGRVYKRYIVDVEETPTEPMTKYQMWTRLYTLLKGIEQLTGIKPAIYTSAGYWNTYLGWQAGSAKYDLILARYVYAYKPGLPLGFQYSQLKVWQFTNHFYFPGCVEKADGNWFFGTMEECKAYY